MQHKKADKDFCNEMITCHKKLVNMILSIGSSTGVIFPISDSKLYWVWQCLNYYTGVRCGQ